MATIVKDWNEDITDNMFEQIPTKVPKYMKYDERDAQELEDIEELVEAGLIDYLDHDAVWTRDELKLFNMQNNIDTVIKDDTNRWPRAGAIEQGLLVVSYIDPFFVSDIEPNNPYYAGPYPSYHNPHKDDYLVSNRVLRKFTDNMTTYMGNPSYNGVDKLIYVDVHGHIDGQSSTVRIVGSMWDDVRDHCCIIDSDIGTFKVIPVYKYKGTYRVATMGNVKWMCDNQLEFITKESHYYNGMFNGDGSALRVKTITDVYKLTDINASINESVLELTDIACDNVRINARKRAMNRQLAMLQSRLNRYINRALYIKEQHIAGKLTIKAFKEDIAIWESRINKVQNEIKALA